MDKKPTKIGIFLGGSRPGKLPGHALLISWSGVRPVLVIVPSPPEPAVKILNDGSYRDVSMWVPTGPILATALTAADKKLLLAKGMNAELLASGRVMSVSDEIANRMREDRAALLELAARCGLSPEILNIIETAKRKLLAIRPDSLKERRAVKALHNVLSCPLPKKGRGRTSKISAADRLQMRRDAAELKLLGKSSRDICMTLAQRYEVRETYAKRILEDAQR